MSLHVFKSSFMSLVKIYSFLHRGLVRFLLHFLMDYFWHLVSPGYKAEMKSLDSGSCFSSKALVSLCYLTFRNVYLFLPLDSSKALSFSCDSLEQPIAFDLHIFFHLIHIYVLLHEWWQGSWSQLAQFSSAKWFLHSHVVLNDGSLWVC